MACLYLLIVFFSFTLLAHCSPDTTRRLLFSSFDQHVHQSLSDNCPAQPLPIDIPSELPDIINNALSQLSALGESYVDNKAVPGVAMGISYKGKNIWSKGFGVKDKNKPGIAPDDDTIFRIGSVSKVFPVIMLYQLYAEGSVQSLDDPLTKYAPDFKINNTFSKSDITLRQMASQLSGLPREAPCGLTPLGLNICPLTNSEILSKLSSQNLLLPSWTRPSYSNLAFALLGNLLATHYDEKKSFEDYAQDQIINPLQLTNTGFKITDDVKDRMAVGYTPDGDEAPLIDLGYISPAGQMYSTINDLNKLSQFFYEAHILAFNDSSVLFSDFESILSSDLRREMSLPYFVNPDGQSGFGTPWEILFDGNYTIRTKGGNINGYSALFSFIPELHLGINALFSGSVDDGTFAKKAFDIFLPPFVSFLSDNVPPVPAPPNPNIYVGHYKALLNVVTANIFVKNNEMYLSYNYSGQVMSVYLYYHDVQSMQMYYPSHLLPCLTGELLAILGKWVYFDPVDKSSGNITGFTIPPVHLKRVSEEF
ncbi:PREDICTED: putative beta-lactamase-like 1 [Amphimedon queenslandica]|nr:PREDICTED: putative beta-lactamase-like 1 [Amphimedon queenslandica]|eukprot:XP_003387189.1 PREDICTED: putative beta-lactamase-like 1 [Amphimedon queenslandica]